jgi:hypothetical protein
VTRRPIGLFLLLTLAPDPGAGQPLPNGVDRRTVRAVRLADSERVILDGRLDEDVWRRTAPAADFVQIDPANGMPATEKTEVHVAYDAHALYLGVICFDSEPDRWVAYQKRRDETLPADDKLRWTIDTFLDGRTGYFFEMNPLGSMADALMGASGQNRQWDGIWEGRARRSGIGWTLEVEIPFRTLNFNPASDTWGINFERTVQRKNETSIWMGWARNQGLMRMTNAGHVTGIRHVTQGRGLDLKPYALAAAQASPGRGAPAFRAERNAGVDLFYNPTPTLRATFTVNTDFAQTEVDQRQVNLTRFSLFFPERRDFFLDGANFFDFSGGGTSEAQVTPFFSRRIGLSAALTPQPIDVGAKLTGQAGRQDVGLLHVRTRAVEGEGMIGEDFTVARIKRRLLQQSYVGALYTRRDGRAPGAGASHTAGLDFRLATARFLGSQNLNATGWFLHATGPGRTTGNAAYGLSVEYPNDRWSGGLYMREVQRNFDPAVGFVTRRDFRRFRSSASFGPRPRASRLVRRFEFGAAAEALTDLDGRMLERAFDFTLLEVTFHSQDGFGLGLTRRYERLDAPFPISRGITLPQGAEYDATRVEASWQTASRRPVSVGGRVETGGFYSGRRHRIVSGLTFRAPGYVLALNAEWNRVRLAQGRFGSHVYRVVGETQFTPFVALVNNVQFDTVSRVLGWQSRFRWILRPGSDLYVVYTHNWLDDPVAGRFTSLDRRAASKLLYTHRL